MCFVILEHHYWNQIKQDVTHTLNCPEKKSPGFWDWIKRNPSNLWKKTTAVTKEGVRETVLSLRGMGCCCAKCQLSSNLGWSHKVWNIMNKSWYSPMWSCQPMKQIITGSWYLGARRYRNCFFQYVKNLFFFIFFLLGGFHGPSALPKSHQFMREAETKSLTQYWSNANTNISMQSIYWHDFTFSTELTNITEMIKCYLPTFQLNIAFHDRNGSFKGN